MGGSGGNGQYNLMSDQVHGHKIPTLNNEISPFKHRYQGGTKNGQVAKWVYTWENGIAQSVNQPSINPVYHVTGGYQGKSQ
jgi:hypothetical protein